MYHLSKYGELLITELKTILNRIRRVLKMKIEQIKWTKEKGWESKPSGSLKESAQLALVFGGTHVLKEKKRFDEIKSFYPAAHILGCSTAGEIMDTRVFDDTLVVTAVFFENTQLQFAQVRLNEVENSFQAGEQLATSLEKDGLVHILVLSDGQKVNGSELVKGLTGNLPDQVTVTGGLAGDGARFEQTLVYLDDVSEDPKIAVLGLYGTSLKVGCGSMGGWDFFGPDRLITRSKENILYELDGKSALELYKEYLGDQASGLPATGLLFPLSIRYGLDQEGTGLVRTILSVNEEDQSMIFAGDVPEGAYARLMKADFDRLVDGAMGAANASYEAIGSTSPDLAVLISCVGRKLVLQQRIEEEVESVREVLGDHTVITGFYSYGEISPFTPTAKCELHNQTMTITTFSER
jgi:hypothetical protein